jgi:hypothetical protein
VRARLSLMSEHLLRPAVLSSSSYAGPADDAMPSSPTSHESKSKKPNPLNDLIETERLYVELLTGIIRASPPIDPISHSTETNGASALLQHGPVQIFHLQS